MQLGRRRRWPWAMLLGFVVLALLGWVMFGDAWRERLREPDRVPPGECSMTRWRAAPA